MKFSGARTIQIFLLLKLLRGNSQFDKSIFDANCELKSATLFQWLILNVVIIAVTIKFIRGLFSVFLSKTK